MPDDQSRKAARDHADGSHGEKTHAAFLDSLKGAPNGDNQTESGARAGSPFGEVSSDGRHRLSEDRQQHDEAEKNSDGAKQRRVDEESETAGP